MDLSERQEAVIETSRAPQPQPKIAATNLEKPSKKPYSTPELAVYGKLSDLTRTVGNTGVLDGGGIAGKNRTST
jgi:hypothetical protein